MRVLSDDALITRVMNAVAAGITTQNSTGVNLAADPGPKFHSVKFIALIGTILATAVTSIKAQQSSDDGAGDPYSDIAGSSVTIPDTGDDAAYFLDVIRPNKSWVRCVVVRGTANATIDGVIAQQYNARKLAVTQTVTGKTLLDPIEGAA